MCSRDLDGPAGKPTATLRCSHCRRRRAVAEFDLVYDSNRQVMYDTHCRACGGSGRMRAPRPTGKRCAVCGNLILRDRSYVWTPAGFIHQTCR